jgi:hypothetical protein
MTKQLTATQVFLRALKETGEYDHVKKVIKYANNCSRHIGGWWKPINVNSRTFVEDLMRENNFNLLFAIEYISLGLEFTNDFKHFTKTTKKIHKWIMTNVNGNYLKRLLKNEIPEFSNGSRRGHHDLKFTWREKN